MKHLLLKILSSLFVLPLLNAQDIKLSGTVSAESNQIKNVADPTTTQDVATKNYVDSNINTFSGSYNDLTAKPNLLQLGTTAGTALAGNTTTISTEQAANIVTNNSKVGMVLGTTAGTALAGDTSLFSGSYSDLTNTPLTITTQQASDIETNNAKISNAQADWNANLGASAILNKPDVYFKEDIDLLIAQMQNQINTMQQELKNLKPYSTVAYDGFDYDQGTTLYNKSGGYGWSEPWDNDSSSQSTFDVRNMHYIINSSSSLIGVYSSSRRSEMTYQDLESVGNYLGNDGQQTDIACFSFRNLSESINSGVYYVQFLVQFNNFSDSDANGAKNNYFILNEDAVDKLVVRRKNGNIYLAKTRLSSEPSDIVDTGVVLKGSSAAQFIIVQMDFDNNKTSIWVDPDLSSFDYVSPSTAPDAFLSYSSSFNRISLISQTKWDYGVPTLFDEISVIKKK